MFDNLFSPFPFTVLQTVTFLLFIPETQFLHGTPASLRKSIS